MNTNSINLFNSYQAWTTTVAKYPKTQEANYLTLGIVDELGEVFEKLDTKAGRIPLTKEIGDVCWYIARYALTVLCIDLGELVRQSRETEPHPVNLSSLFRAVGIVCGVEKKRIRDGANWHSGLVEAKNMLSQTNVIEVIQFLDGLCRSINTTLEIACGVNMQKLDDRRKRDTIGGDGDTR